MPPSHQKNQQHVAAKIHQAYLSAVLRVFVPPYDEYFAVEALFIFPTFVTHRLDLILCEAQTLYRDGPHFSGGNLRGKLG